MINGLVSLKNFKLPFSGFFNQLPAICITWIRLSMSTETSLSWISINHQEKNRKSFQKQWPNFHSSSTKISAVIKFKELPKHSSRKNKMIQPWLSSMKGWRIKFCLIYMRLLAWISLAFNPQRKRFKFRPNSRLRKPSKTKKRPRRSIQQKSVKK